MVLRSVQVFAKYPTLDLSERKDFLKNCIDKILAASWPVFSPTHSLAYMQTFFFCRSFFAKKYFCHRIEFFFSTDWLKWLCKEPHPGSCMWPQADHQKPVNMHWLSTKGQIETHDGLLGWTINVLESLTIASCPPYPLDVSSGVVLFVSLHPASPLCPLFLCTREK